MATIDITTQSGAVGNGDLQLQNGAPMDATLRFVTDAVNTASPLKLSTSLVQTTSTLKITTNDNPYIDAEDGAGNNRFTVGRATSSQQVNVDFASNPTGSTTAVGAIRTYRDGVNLSEAMTFIEDGSVGIGTTAPVGILDLFKSAAATRLAIRGDAGQNRLISYRTGAVQRFGLYVNNTAESGANAGSNFAIRAYSDAGTLLSTPLFIERSTGNVGINTTTPAYKLEVSGTFSSVGTNIISITDTAHIYKGTPDAVGFEYAKILSGRDATSFNYGSFLAFYTEGKSSGTTDTSTERMRITSTGNVGIGVNTPTTQLEVQNAAAGTAVKVSNTGGGFAQLAISSNATSIAELSFTNSLGITGGNVGIGTTSPEINLDIKGTATASSMGIFIENAAVSTLNNTADIYFGTWGGSNIAGITNARISAVNVNAGNAESNIDFYTWNGTANGKRVSITSNGLTFNGDTAAANALDDYEEGTFTPSMTFGGGSTGVTYFDRQGNYTKIGRQVTCTIYLALTSKGSSTGVATITGLPFTSSNANRGIASGCSFRFDNVTYLGQVQMVVGQNSSVIDFWQTTELGTDSLLTDTNFGNASEFQITATYFV